MRRQDESDASRKNLIELIRGFKKNNPEEIRQEQLQLKAYSPVLIKKKWYDYVTESLSLIG
jgi:hypothetical protein